MKLAIIDFNRTLYDPETDTLISGALEMLAFLQLRDYRLVLVSKRELSRGQKVSDLGLDGFFDEILFTLQKTPQLFMEIIERHNAVPAETIVIGDHPLEEIRSGSTVGARTIRLMRGKFSSLPHEEREVWQTINDLSEVKNWID